MSIGLFALICPQCVAEVDPDPSGAVTCPNCGQTYLTRFGHLIPVALEPTANAPS